MNNSRNPENVPHDEGIGQHSTTNNPNERLICVSSSGKEAFDPCFYCYFYELCAEKIFNEFEKCPVCKGEATRVKKGLRIAKNS